MKYFVCNNRLYKQNKKKYFYIESANHDTALGEVFNRLKHTDFSIYEAIEAIEDIPECVVTPETTNIYLCTLDNGGYSHDDYEDYTITVTANNSTQARKNAMKKFNSTPYEFGDSCIQNGGQLSVNLEYKDVILNSKK